MNIFVIQREEWTHETYNGHDCYTTVLCPEFGYFTDEEEVAAKVKSLNLKSTPEGHKFNEQQRKKEYDRELKKHQDHVKAATLLAENGIKANLGWTPRHPGKFVPQPYVEEYGYEYSYEELEPYE